MACMDSTDVQILALLSHDGRMSYTDVGRAAGLSTSAAQQRIRHLEQRGYISGYHAHLSASALGRDMTAFISLRACNSKQDDSIPELLAAMPEITCCYSVAGDASFLCAARVGTTDDLERLLNRIRHIADVSTSTTVVLKTFFRGRPLINQGDSNELWDTEN